MKRLTTQLIPAAAMAASAILAGSVHAETILSEDFVVVGPAGNLNGTTEDQNGVSWVATPTNLLTDGTIGGIGAGTATLAFTPIDGFTYTLDASFTGITGDGNWVAFGFVNGQGTGSATSGGSENRFLEEQTTGIAWMFARGTNDLLADPNNVNVAFLGDPTEDANGVGNSDGETWAGALSDADGGDFDMRIVLDTTGGTGNWTATWFAKRPADGSYTEVRATANLLNESITSVGFGESNTGVSGSIESFSLTAVPEPGSLAILGLGGLLVASRRRRG